MIFNKEFDKSLWLILKGDNDKKRMVLDLISSIPAPLYQQIVDALVKFCEVREKDNIYILDREDINGEFLLNENYKYYFTLDMVLSCLIVGKKVLLRGEYQKIFELTLFSDASYNKVENFGEQYLGSIYQPYLNSAVNYELISTLLGMMVVTRKPDCLPMYKKVNINTIPNDITINELDENKRLLKIRKMY